MFVDEKTINENIQYSLSVISENISQHGKLVPDESVSQDEAMSLFANMIKSPQKSFTDIAKSPKTAKAMNNLILQGVHFFEKIQDKINVDEMQSEIVEEINELIAGLDGMLTAMPISPKPKKEELPFEHYIIDRTYTNEVVSTLHEIMDKRRGKDATLVLVCAIELGIISRPPYSATKKQFPSVGCKSNYNNYMTFVYTEQEKNPIKQLLKKRLPTLLS